MIPKEVKKQNVLERCKQAFIETVTLLLILLFVYAALNKILDFQNFQVQLGQSPLLSAFAGWLSYFVPALEFVIVILLLKVSWRYAGLFASFCLMLMFTVYIFVILHYSPFIPCSCGGVLEKMTWDQHLTFNIAFTVLSLVALLISRTTHEPVYIIKRKIQIAAIIAGAIVSVVIILGLYMLSENIVHHRNNFTRRFPHHPTTFKSEINLYLNSYYIAGFDDQNIYLGNTQAPLVLTVTDWALTSRKQISIDIPHYDFKYTSPRLVVRAPYFYFVDGTVPCVFKGNVNEWKGRLYSSKGPYFTQFEAVNDSLFAVRSSAAKTNENVLGLMAPGDALPFVPHPELLQKQIDGIFDTDGMLLYNRESGKVIYTYYYRNQFLICDSSLNLSFSGNTIDTISRAQIQVAKIDSKRITTLAKQPLMVNRKSATYSNYLFINSELIGKFENREMWGLASVVDVYDLKNHTYAFSFYVDNRDLKKMDEFAVFKDRLVVLTDNFLTIYDLKSNYYKPDKGTE